MTQAWRHGAFETGRAVQVRVVLIGGDPAFRQQIDWSRLDQSLAKLIAPTLPKSS